jgi:ADP-heptose:LPS heptosyltransferase
VGYDSAGQHVAAACGVPLVSVFAGYPCERFLDRWRPWGPGRIEVVRADGDALAATLAAVSKIR